MTRMWHTACCTTSPGEVLIFGGCATSVLILEQVNRQQFQIHASVCIIYCTVSIYATVYQWWNSLMTVFAIFLGNQNLTSHPDRTIF